MINFSLFQNSREFHSYFKVCYIHLVGIHILLHRCFFSVQALVWEFSGMSIKKSSKHLENDVHIVSVEGVKNYLARSYELGLPETETIVATFGEALRGYLQNLLQAVKGKDGEEGSAQAHGLKGACLNLGLPEQASRAERLEKELSQNNPEKYEAEVEQLIDELRPLTDRV
jgi:HPt (histidine-containing phosphotransfer) domain-containing protein